MLCKAETILLIINAAVNRDDVHWRQAIDKVREMVQEDQDRLALLRMEIDGYKEYIRVLQSTRTP